MNSFIRTLALTLAAALGLSGFAAAAPYAAGADMNPEQLAMTDKLHEEYYKNTEATRQELISKKFELDAQLYSANPDDKKIQALTREISDLRAKLYNARISLKGKLIREGVSWGHRGGYGRCGGYYGRGEDGYRGGYGHRGGHGYGMGGRGGRPPCGADGDAPCYGPR